AVTTDDYIVSGHRRRVACQLAGLKVVPVRVLGFARGEGGDEYLNKLVTFNRQRVKSTDELLREEVIQANPEEGHRMLLAHRQEAAKANRAKIIPVEGVMSRSEISDAKWPFFMACRDVLNKYAEFWPLTLRQIHYYLLNDPPLRHARKPGSA